MNIKHKEKVSHYIHQSIHDLLCTKLEGNQIFEGLNSL